MRVLVTGGTGTVGSAVVGELLARGAEVSVLTRDASKASRLPAGVRAVEGNLLDPAAVRRIFDGQEGLFLLNQVSPSETQEGLMAVCGAMQSEIGRVVYLSVHLADQAAYLPHFGSKLAVEAGLDASGIPYTILRPNNFYQNDSWFRDVILGHGVYPQPIGNAGLSRVDVRDIAEAAAIALTTEGHDGETYDLVGPEALTAESTVAIWSEVLGREIAYGGEDMDAWEQQNAQYMPATVAYDFRLMYEFFQREGLRASDDAIERQTRLLGHPPRDYATYVRETAAAWQAGGG